MRPAFLALDHAMDGQPQLRARAAQMDACRVAADDIGPALRLWSPPAALEALRLRLRDELPAGEGARLVFAGSGDFHHVTPLLVARALEASAGPVTLVHVDNHPDWVRFASGYHCGSWVGAAARTPGVARIVTFGVCSGDVFGARARAGDLALVEEGRHVLFAYRAENGAAELSLAGVRRPTIAAMGLEAFVAELLTHITTEAVYITIDKDALRSEDAATNWDQGAMSLDEMAACLSAVMKRHRVIGADVVGDWSPARYGGGGLAPMLKFAEALLDQPWRAPTNVDRINEAANLRLLDLFCEAA